VEIFRIDMLDADGQVISAPKMKQDFCLKICCKFHKSGIYTVAMGFRDANGLKIASVSDEKKSCWLTGNKGDIYTLTIKLNNVFLAGRYSISILVKDKYENKIDYMRDLFFEVLPMLIDAGRHYNSGVVQIDSEWGVPVRI
jgi:hypothetical protein